MKKRVLLILFFVIFALLYTSTLKGSWKNVNTNNIPTQSIKARSAFESSHERATFAETISVVETGRFSLTQTLANFGSPDVGFYKNRFYSLFPPGVSISIIPLYLLGQRYNLSQIFSYATISILALFSLILLYKISREIFELSFSLSLFTCVIFGFASSAWAYSTTIYQHIPTVFLILLAFYTAWKLKNAKKFNFIWGAISWGTLGISIFFDYPNLLLIIPIVIYLVRNLISLKKVKNEYKLKINLATIISGLFFIAAISLHLLFSHSVYGSWFKTTNTIHRYDLNNTTTLSTTSETDVSSVFKEDRFLQGLYLLTIAPEKGIFIFAPILILSVFGVSSLVKRQTSEKWLLLAMPLVNLFVYASFGDPWGGWAFGPRYLIPSIPFLTILIGLWIKDSSKITLKKIIAFVIFIVSASIAIGGALTSNLLPPKVEAVYLHIPYGLTVTWNNLRYNHSSSFIYNTYLIHKITLIQYGLVIFAAVVVLGIITLFLLPLIINEN